MIHTIVLQTALGRVTVAWKDGRLREIRLERLERNTAIQRSFVIEGRAPNAQGEAIVSALTGYFSGEKVAFPEPPIEDATPFQQAVWRATREIPHGETQTYGQVAETLGRPKAARAVGAALGKNPFPVVIPCHRVVGASGALTGFAGGVEWKAALLALERPRLGSGEKQLLRPRTAPPGPHPEAAG